MLCKYLWLFTYWQETHILHNFESDFYGSMLKTCIINYIRPEQSYDSLGNM